MAERQAWWDSPVAIAVAIVLATVPLLYPPIPPLVDLLGHMGRFSVELDGGHSPWLQQYYAFRWAPIGNLGVDLLVRLIAPLVGLEPAVKLVIVAIPALTVAGLLWVAREVHERIPPTAFFAIPFVYGHPFLYGFVNFALSMALALLAFGLWLRLGSVGRTRLRAALFVLISLIVYFAHAFGWGVLGLMCFAAEAVRRNERGSTRARSVYEAALASSVLALPLLVMLMWRSGTEGSGTGYWFDFQAKFVWIETALRDRWRWLDLASVLAAALVLAQALRSPRLTFSRELAYPGLALLAVFILLPDLIFESAYADMRLVPYMFAIFLIAIRVEPSAPRSYATTLAALAVAFVAVRLTANTISFAISADDQHAKSAAVAHIPEGARVATFLPQFVLPNGCYDGLHRTIDRTLASLPRRDFDYVWLVDPPAFDPRLLAGLEPVWAGAGTTLYRVRG